MTMRSAAENGREKSAGNQFTGVGFFHDHHARILPQFPRKLRVSDVHRIDPGRAALQEAIREPAGRSAEVNDGLPGDIQFEELQGVFEFETATADIFSGAVSARWSSGWTGSAALRAGC